jgi:RimJ/RimL family protein N-acetyltransferase
MPSRRSRIDATHSQTQRSAPVKYLDLAAAPKSLSTEHVLLESARSDHAAAFAEGVAASMSNLTYVEWKGGAEWAAEFSEHDERNVAAGKYLVFHVFEKADGGWVGRIDIHTIDFDACRGEIGYVGDQRRAGRGLMREAALAVIECCFALGFERIEAMSDSRNARALDFAVALGMQREGLLRRHERDPRGELCDMVLFARLR